MNTKIIPPNFPDVEIFNVGHSEEELAVLKETAKWFNTRVTKNTEHLLIAEKEQFVGIVEYRDNGNNTATVTGMWCNVDFVLQFLITFFFNFGLNYKTVQIKHQGNELTLILNQTPVENFNPLHTSSARLLSLDVDPEGKRRSTLLSLRPE